MKAAGVMSGNQADGGKNPNIIDQEKMQEFESRLEQEKNDFLQKSENDRANIEKNAALAEDEKKRLIQELRDKEHAEEKAKKKKEKMIKRLKKMEEKMVVGDQALVIAKS
jgi:hypothetical protein